MTQELVKDFVRVVGDRGVIASDKALLNEYATDWTKAHLGEPSCIVMPANRDELCHVVRYCYENDLAMVPSGGRTGLAGGCVSDSRQVVISLSRMNRILDMDTVSMTASVEAGVVTEDLQNKALDNGVFFALDLAAKGSCQIGGNLATNAGGLRFIRYGGMREQVLGLEVVLADGTLLDLNRGLRKDNSGYDLKHLFIGSEGTLGIISAATIALTRKPTELHTALCSVASMQEVLEVLKQLNEQGLVIAAFEFFSRNALETVLKVHKKQDVLGEPQEFYVLIELEESEETALGFYERAFQSGILTDGVLATSSEEQANLWSYRELITESLATEYMVHKNDISVPIQALNGFFQQVKKLTVGSNIQLVHFGHVGDGNIHINYVGSDFSSYQEFLSQVKPIETELYGLLRDWKGSLSAAHGIGLLKRESFALNCDPKELNFMRQIKKVFDSKNLMNPGKIFQ